MDWLVPTFRGLIPWWLGAMIALVAGAGIVYLYLLERTRAGLLRRLLMAGIRFAVVLLLIAVFVRPVWVAVERGERPRPIVILVDSSLSMTQQDQRLSAEDRLRVAIALGLADAPSVMKDISPSDVPEQTPEHPARAEVLKATLSNAKLDLIERLERHGPVRTYLFGQRLQSLSDASLTKAASQSTQQRILSALGTKEPPLFADQQTALADAVHEILTRNEDLPAAIIVMTDGRDNASRLSLEDAAHECKERKVPLYIYGVGSSDVGNLQLREIAAPDTIFYNDVVSVPVLWRCQGFKQGNAIIKVTVGGKEVARKEVPVRPDDDLRETLTFTPTKKANEKEENTDIVVTINYEGHETFTADNEIKRPVKLIDNKLKVLYVEYSPRWEYKFLMTLLLRDRRVEPKFLLLNADPKALIEGPTSPYITAFPATREELFKYDLLILGDIPATRLNRDQMTWIEDFVKEGGGLVHIAGRQHAPASFHETPLANVLPVEFKPQKFPVEADARTRTFQPVLTEAGERSEMLFLAETQEENLKIWKELPGFYWHYPVTKLRPNAMALLAHPKLKVGDDPMPLIAVARYGKGSVLFLAVDEIWRWRYNVRDQYIARFWGQIVYQMGLPHILTQSKRVQLALERSENVLGRPSYVYARLFTSDFKPMTEERVPARLEYLDAQREEDRFRPIMLEKIAGLPGEYRALLPNHVTGRFAVRVDNPETATLEYRVHLPPAHEMEIAGMAEDSLRKVALESGPIPGEKHNWVNFYREEDLHRLPEQIKGAATPVVYPPHEVPRWTAPFTLVMVLLLFTGLITIEWLMRKFADLS